MSGIFPYEKQELIINIPYTELVAELKKSVQLTSYIPLIKSQGSKQFYGSTTSSIWKMRLKTNYRNSFKPVTYLRIIEEGENKTRMIFEFKIHIIVRVFLLVYLSFLLILVIYNLIENNPLESYYFPIGFIGVLFLLMYMGFFMSLGHTTEALYILIEKIKKTTRKKQ